MKYILFLISVGCFNSSTAQSAAFIRSVEQSVSLHINIPSNVTHDSCYYSNTLLKVEIDKRYKIRSISFSDNAEKWLTEGLNKIRDKMDIEKLEKFARDEHLKNCTILIPYIIRSVSFPCTGRLPDDVITKKEYFLFGGKPLPGKILYADALVSSFYKPNH